MIKYFANSSLPYWGLGFGLCLGLSIQFQPVQAAETVVLKYSILRESIPVAELSDLAATGELSPRLKTYLDLANQNPDKVRNVLNQPVEVNPTNLSKVLNSWPGEGVLGLLSDVIHTPSGRASKESLRGALVSSAVDDNNIRLIEMLENYPTQEVHVEGDRLVKVYEQFSQVVSVLNQLDLNF